MFGLFVRYLFDTFHLPATDPLLVQSAESDATPEKMLKGYSKGEHRS